MIVVFQINIVRKIITDSEISAPIADPSVKRTIFLTPFGTNGYQWTRHPC